MRFVFVALPVGMMVLLAGCALLTEDAPEVTAGPASAQTVEVPPPSPETELPASRAAVLVLPPSGKPAAMHAGSGSLPARAANAAAVRQAPVAKPPLAADPAKTFRGVTKEAGKDAKAIPGPAWLSSCQHRQQQGDVIMCDADSLLAQPSDKVMVYVRDVKLVRRSSNGQGIGLRESLPRLYRIFVLE